jgi:hypothetical protein
MPPIMLALAGRCHTAPLHYVTCYTYYAISAAALQTESTATVPV